jgi:hypothetical protein
MSNVASIMSHGILSHKRAKRIQHDSVAMQEIQDRRRNKVVPGGHPLHQYVNLYICARNPMLYKRRAQHIDLCVLRVSTDILDLPGVVISDCNASSDYVRFAPSPEGLSIIDEERTFAEYWVHNDPIETYRHRSQKCAEVLVPNSVDQNFITGAYVSGATAEVAFNVTGVNIPVTIDSHLFFV